VDLASVFMHLTLKQHDLQWRNFAYRSVTTKPNHHQTRRAKWI